MGIIQFILLLVVGGVSGAIGALCGVGGGIILVPVLALAMGLPQKQAVATSLAVIILTSAVATFKNNQGAGLIHWQIALPIALGSVVITWMAADALKQMSNETLVRLFAVVMILAGISMLVLRRGEPAKPAAPMQETAQVVPEEK